MNTRTHNIIESAPIFSQPWWLDTVCGPNNWAQVDVQKEGHSIAVLPYAITSKFGQTCLSMPPLTQTLGVHILYPENQSYAKKLSFEKTVMTKLIEQLPTFAYFSQNFHFSFTNWLPFYWAGFEQTTRYTYRLPTLSDLDQTYAGFQSKIRTDIQKAAKTITIEDSQDIPAFYELVTHTFQRQNLKVPYSRRFLDALITACFHNKCGKLFLGRGKDGSLHAGVLIVWDSQSAYYLIGGADPQFRNSGATSFLIWEAIKFSATVTQSFDFEGSMIEPVERFFQRIWCHSNTVFHYSKISLHTNENGCFFERS